MNIGEFGETVDCLGVGVRRATWQEFRTWVLEALTASPASTPIVIAIANASTLNLAWSNDAYRAVLNSFDLVLNDGVGLEIYSRMARKAFIYNFNGTDLWGRVFDEAPPLSRPVTVYLYGGRPENVRKAAIAFEAKHRNIRIIGVSDGYVTSDEELVEDINRVTPDLLLVGMGNPLQEQWIARHRERLAVRIACGVGALFDFMSGAVPRAPKWMQRSRMEWIYRLQHEPVRLFSRYVLGNPLFLGRAAIHLARRAVSEESSR